MSAEDILESLKNFDTDQLNDLNNVGSWPIAVKFILWIFVFVGVLAAGYFALITGMQEDLEKAEKKEVQLRKEYEEKAQEASLLEDYRRQNREMEELFFNILRQLPSETEIPGLIEDINNAGLKNNLSFSTIDMQKDVRHEYYVEKPIRIVVSGSYHDIGSFVSDIADLSRIVTLHDFTISPVKAGGKNAAGEGETLTMTITAKTYRYNDGKG
ncbi:MAG: type 4a pilus biogenesis protein PilO [Gammaproteobacteria bacterium]|nr:type 4a pilus biogenesis protein PilO [Gammaproteobacteria bacterium]